MHLLKMSLLLYITNEAALKDTSEELIELTWVHVYA